MASGIYRIIIARPNKSPMYYIGQTVNLRDRRAGHLRLLRIGKHKNIRLQRAFAKYGEGAFEFQALVICEARKEILSLYEQAILDSYPRSTLYNISRKCVDSRLGVTTTPETRAKMSAAAIGKKRSAETCARLSAAKKGWKPSPEHIARLRIINTGRVVSAHTKELLRIAGTGKKKPPEQIARQQATRRANAEARGYWCSPEWRAKQSARPDLRNRHL